MTEAHEQIEKFRGRTEPEMAKWIGQMLKNNIADAARALRRTKRKLSQGQQDVMLLHHLEGRKFRRTQRNSPKRILLLPAG